MTLLSLQGVTRRFGGLVAVDAIDLEVAEGGVTAVIGPNGAGKTTLFNVISRLPDPKCRPGRVRRAGHHRAAPPEAIAAAGLVRTFQLVQLFRNLSVLENIEVGCHLHTNGRILVGAAAHRAARGRPSERSRRGRASCWASSGSTPPPRRG